MSTAKKIPSVAALITTRNYADKLREKSLTRQTVKSSEQTLSINNIVCEQNASSIDVLTASSDKTSDFYTACRNGDLELVRSCIVHMDIDALNKIEPNGSTALHAASFNGHLEIVKLLLDRQCSCHIKDKYGRTARDTAVTKEILGLLNGKLPYFCDSIDIPPESDRLVVYQNSNNQDKSELATRITKARLAIYNIHKYQINGDTNTAQLEKIFRKHCKQNEVEANQCLMELEEFKRSKNIYILVALYLMETFVYRSPIVDDSFLIEMYINFAQFNNGFPGTLFSGHRMTNEQLKPYCYAFENKESILETRRFCSTTPDQDVAMRFARLRTQDGTIGVILVFCFREKCYTTAKLKTKPANLESLKYFEDEQGGMILPGTFFTIQDISRSSSADDDIVTVVLNNVPVDRSVIMEEIKEFN